MEVRQDVLNAMTAPMITHRGVEYKKLHRNIVNRMKELLHTENDILMLPASSTGAMEAAVRSTVSERIMHLTCGAFGERWVEISKSNGKIVTQISTEWGNGISAELLEEAEGIEETECVAITHNETSTGVMNPLEEIASAVRKKGDPLLLVDAVTSAFANTIDLRKVKADVFIFGTQKALALPPGLAFAVVSPRTIEKAKMVKNRGRYLDLLEIKEFADRDLVPTTPPISLMYALDYQLQKIEQEGMERRSQRHRTLGEMARKWASENMALFTRDGFYSNTVTCVKNTAGIEYSTIDRELGRRGYQISEGYGRLKPETFRIGHMGDLTTDEMKGLLEALSEVLK